MIFNIFDNTCNFFLLTLICNKFTAKDCEKTNLFNTLIPQQTVFQLTDFQLTDFQAIDNQLTDFQQTDFQ